MNDDRGTWKSKITFVLAAAGSAVGLGNLWRFSYEAGNNGGGLFVLIYLIAVLVIGLPILLAELSIGRFSHRDTVGAFGAIRPRTRFKGVGYLGLITAIMILAFYSVVAGQAVGYIYKSVSGEFAQLSDPGLTRDTVQEYRDIFRQQDSVRESLTDFFTRYPDIKGGYEDLADRSLLLADRLEKKQAIQEEMDQIVREMEMQLLVNRSTDIFNDLDTNKNQLKIFSIRLELNYLKVFFLFIFMFFTVFIVSKGISGGIERFTRIFMPVLLVILVMMIVRALTLPNAFQGVAFYLAPKFSQLSPKLIISAIGQAFFSLSLGMGTMITYGSYVSKKEKLPASAGMIGLFDTGIAIFAGFIVFPVIFSLGMNPKQGAGGIFIVLPILFSKIPMGQFFAVLFFILLSIAALTSTISLLEVPVAYMVDQRGWKRVKASWLLIALALLFAIPCALFPGFFGLWNTIWGSFALTIGGLLISIFVGWVWKPAAALQEIRQGAGKFALGPVWHFLIKYVIPLFLIAILASNIIDLM